MNTAFKLISFVWLFAMTVAFLQYFALLQISGGEMTLKIVYQGIVGHVLLVSWVIFAKLGEIK